MNRLSQTIFVLLCFEMGAVLLYLPWSHHWDQNYFLSRFPALVPVLLHPSLRGVVSGLGALDIYLGILKILEHTRTSRASAS
ncbi:MAG: hypothetical protein LAN71_03770 [Acidobacteriia bacterium]|nr:hypothetical protein [Terriglobia bacterium]